MQSSPKSDKHKSYIDSVLRLKTKKVNSGELSICTVKVFKILEFLVSGLGNSLDYIQNYIFSIHFIFSRNVEWPLMPCFASSCWKTPESVLSQGAALVRKKEPITSGE